LISAPSERSTDLLPSRVHEFVLTLSAYVDKEKHPLVRSSKSSFTLFVRA
jgi:hypothetical protein